MATLSPIATKNRHTTPIHEDAYYADFVAEGWTAATTHEIIDIPQGWACIGGYFVVTTTFTGLTSLQFAIGGNTMSGAIAAANLVAGDVGEFNVGSVTGTTTVTDAYADGADDTLDGIIVGTLTAGKMIIIPKLVRIDSALDQV